MGHARGPQGRGGLPLRAPLPDYHQESHSEATVPSNSLEAKQEEAGHAMKRIHLVDLDGVVVKPGTWGLLPGVHQRLRELVDSGDIWFFSYWAFDELQMAFLRALGIPFEVLHKPFADEYVYIDDKLNLSLSGTMLKVEEVEMVCDKCHRACSAEARCRCECLCAACGGVCCRCLAQAEDQGRRVDPWDGYFQHLHMDSVKEIEIESITVPGQPITGRE